jgi:CheY-like chemotaxis protein
MGAVKMFVLVVEDEADFIEELKQICTELPGTTELLVATSRRTAFTFLDAGFFDLIVLDLNIPTLEGALGTC